MYRHFLVPIDHTDDSVELVVRAVNLAASMNARVTFLHTETPHHGGAAPANLEVDLIDPQGLADETLAKAEAAARAWGVPSHALTASTHDAGAAIAETARNRGCDLILVAGHGSPHSAATPEAQIGVLQHSDLPVLITSTAAVASSVPAIRTLREEHRLLATVLHAWSQALDADDPVPDRWMPSILAFIDRLETDHHPKEKALFLRLRERTSTVDADLDEIGRQHDREGAMLADLDGRVQAVLIGADPAVRQRARRALAASAAAYTRFIWDHLGREEAVVLPAARRHLHEADWTELAQVFSQADAPARTLENHRLLKDILDRVAGLPPRTPGRSNAGHAAIPSRSDGRASGP